MATYVLNNPSHSGGQITFTSPPANNDVCPCGSGMALLVVNPAANGTVTVSIPALTDDGLVVGPRVVSVPQATSFLIPMVSSVYGTSATLTYTGTLATVQVALITSPGT
jgi:hypothetical protein